jgi:hypothetical protein
VTTTSWTPELAKWAGERWVEGWSASRIAGALGMTRNQVIGKVNRMGLGRTSIGTPRSFAPDAGAVPPPPPPAARRPRPDKPGIDHRPAIREALARRQQLHFTVAGVERDHDLLPPRGRKACAWPLGDRAEGTLRACGCAVVSGRMYCARHLRDAGMRVAPKPMRTMGGRVARPYQIRDLDEAR